MRVDDDAPSVMNIELKASTTAEMNEIVLTVEVKCQGEDGKTVTAWTDSTKVLSLPKTKPLPRGPKAARVIGSKAKPIFDKFRADVVQARARAKTESKAEQE